jgi:hypothetical protein
MCILELSYDTTEVQLDLDSLSPFISSTLVASDANPIASAKRVRAPPGTVVVAVFL